MKRSPAGVLEPLSCLKIIIINLYDVIVLIKVPRVRAVIDFGKGSVLLKAHGALKSLTFYQKMGFLV